MLTAPIFSARNVPPTIRAAISMIIALLLFRLLPYQYNISNWNIADYLLVGGRELFIGILLGVIPRLMFAAIEFAGSVIGFQMGFSIVNVVDPQTDTQVSIIASFETMVATLLFVVLDGHHIFIEAISWSFSKIPIAGFQFSDSIGEMLIRFSADLFVIGFVLGSPIIISMLLANVIMGFMARSIPQMNVFIVGFPFTIGLGLIMLALGVPFMVEAMTKLFFSAGEQIQQMIHAIPR